MNWRYMKNFLGMIIWIGFFCAILFLSIKHQPTKPDPISNFAPEFEDDFDCCTGEQEKKEMREIERMTKKEYYKRLLKH